MLLWCITKKGESVLAKRLSDEWYRYSVITYVENTLMGSERMDETDPVNSVLYILQAVKGTTPNQAKATIV